VCLNISTSLVISNYEIRLHDGKVMKLHATNMKNVAAYSASNVVHYTGIRASWQVT